MISEEYRLLNEQLHHERRDYGAFGHAVADKVMLACSTLKTQDVLDYGCGKATLNCNLPFGIYNYDPAVEKYAAPPEPADIVVCHDVMEHVEPEYVDEVLEHIASLTRHLALFVIHCRPAKKSLPDGRNAHVSLHAPDIWLGKLRKHFDFDDYTFEEGFLKLAASSNAWRAAH